jgi:hypothetical protein
MPIEYLKQAQRTVQALDTSTTDTVRWACLRYSIGIGPVFPAPPRVGKARWPPRLKPEWRTRHLPGTP